MPENDSTATDDGRTVSSDTFENPSIKQLASVKTAVDGNGVERVVTTNTDGWSPAPMEATDEQKAHMEKMNEVFDQSKTERTEALQRGTDGTEIKDEDRQINNPGEGGTQTAAPTEAEAEEKKEKAEEASGKESAGGKASTAATSTRGGSR